MERRGKIHTVAEKPPDSRHFCHVLCNTVLIFSRQCDQKSSLTSFFFPGLKPWTTGNVSQMHVGGMHAT